MNVISVRVDKLLDDKLNKLAVAQNVTKSEMARIILDSGIQKFECEENILNKIFNLSIQNWVYSKILLEELISKEKFSEAKRLAKTILEQELQGEKRDEHFMECN